MQYDKDEAFALTKKTQLFWEVLRDVGVGFRACPLLLTSVEQNVQAEESNIFKVLDIFVWS